MIFNDKDSNNAQKQDAVLEVAQTLSNSLIERLVNQTMATLESQTESEAEAENTETDVEAKSENTEAASVEEEET
jgi:hypothetical protein